ncbi:MAG: hypothetical protein RSF79_19120 [Janthinobacterium sp.]
MDGIARCRLGTFQVQYDELPKRQCGTADGAHGDTAPPSARPRRISEQQQQYGHGQQGPQGHVEFTCRIVVVQHIGCKNDEVQQQSTEHQIIAALQVQTRAFPQLLARSSTSAPREYPLLTASANAEKRKTQTEVRPSMNILGNACVAIMATVAT